MGRRHIGPDPRRWLPNNHPYRTDERFGDPCYAHPPVQKHHGYFSQSGELAARLNANLDMTSPMTNINGMKYLPLLAGLELFDAELDAPHDISHLVRNFAEHGISTLMKKETRLILPTLKLH